MRRKIAALVAAVMVILPFGAGGVRAAEDQAANNVAVENINQIVQQITYAYVNTIDYKELKLNVLKAVMKSLDPYSVYMEPQESSGFKQTVDNQYVGIGVIISKKGASFSIDQVLKGSPAEKAGLKMNDVIEAIDGYELSKVKAISDLTEKIRGKEGTSVKILITRAGKKIDFNIKRAKVSALSVNYKILNNDMGYIAISQIATDTYNQFKEAEDFFKKKGIKKIVLDLRGNGGGYMDVATQICRDIIPKGKIATVKYTGYDPITIESYQEKAPFKMTVLVDNNTASAAEYIAGAIKDRGVGLLVGQKSYGKSVMQQMYAVNMTKDGDIYISSDSEQGNIGSIKLTIGKYYTPNGEYINGKGLSGVLSAPYAEILVSKDMDPFNYDIVLKGNFKIGVKSNIVKALEEKLKVLGYISSADESFDKNTVNALAKYQKAKKIKVKTFGEVDAETLKTLDNDIKGAYQKALQDDSQLKVAEKVLQGM